MSEELKPCPFCGSPAEQFAGDTYCTGRQCAAIIQATTKDCSGKRWNTRTPDPKLTEAMSLIGEMKNAASYMLWENGSLNKASVALRGAITKAEKFIEEE